MNAVCCVDTGCAMPFSGLAFLICCPLLRQADVQEQERKTKFDRYAMLPNGEGRWYWRYRLRPDSMKRKTFEHSPEKTKSELPAEQAETQPQQ